LSCKIKEAPKDGGKDEGKDGGKDDKCQSYEYWTDKGCMDNI